MKSLTRDELNRLLDAAGSDRLMFTVMFNHGLRVSEVIALDETNVIGGHLIVQRLKKSCKTTQPLLADEQGLTTMTGKFFPMRRETVWRKMQAYGKKAGIPSFKCHPHAMKHSTGRLGYEGGMGIPELQKYLGHKNGGNTMVYLEADEMQAASAFAAAMGK
jgi:integrase